MNWVMGRGFSIYYKLLRICLGYGKGVFSLENVGWIGVFEECPTLHQHGCSLTVSWGHYPMVLASFEEFSHDFQMSSRQIFLMLLGVSFINGLLN